MLSVPVIAAAAPKAISGMEGKTIGYVAVAVDHQLPDTFSKLFFVQAGSARDERRSIKFGSPSSTSSRKETAERDRQTERGLLKKLS